MVQYWNYVIRAHEALALRGDLVIQLGVPPKLPISGRAVAIKSDLGGLSYNRKSHSTNKVAL